ncbi:hypothetical protein [Leptospira kanakyensis]|uniref:hypothetical protein n=1 Tax=Leptospira kanakyensis TaxID=2484968 RepID=UPI00223E70C1|nr:hypothetical protein [Leptospira kanakyensis]MCW7483224.1 hypothetical protein [Leptospira kanakyensis]
MKIKQILLILTFFITSLNAEESSTKQTYAEFGIKIQNINYKPYEFRPKSELFTNSKSKLSYSEDQIFPAFAKYRNYTKKFGIDFDMASFDISNSFYRATNLPNSYQFKIGNSSRDEFNLNFYYLPFNNHPNIFYFGFGLKKIDRLYQIQNDYRSERLFSDKIVSYGIIVPFRSNINIFENLFLNLGLDPYITLGKRKFVNQTAYSNSFGQNEYPVIYYTDTNPNSITEIIGYQADLSLSYTFLETWKLYIGGTINKSRIRFINSNQTNYEYWGDANRLYITSDNSGILSYNKYKSKYDTFTSLYFGISIIY